MTKFLNILPWIMLIIAGITLFTALNAGQELEEKEKAWLSKEVEYKRIVSLLEASNEIYIARAQRISDERDILEEKLDSLNIKDDEIYIKPIPINDGDVARAISNRIEQSRRERDTISIQ